MARLYRADEADVGTTARKALTPFLSAGEIFGRLTAVRPIPPVKPGVGSTQPWSFRCDCGNEVARVARDVTRSKNASCGCANSKARTDVVGKRFGRWFVLSDTDEQRGNRRSVLCACDCGSQATVNVCHLRSGKSVSCGCYKQEHAWKNNFKHGHGSKKTDRGASAEYRIWSLMKSRCSNPNLKEYRLYGARGITVCAHWAESFPAFLADMGPRPSPRHSIDRINGNGNYEPKNCRWATPKEQANNTSRNRFVSVQGARMTLAQAVERFGGNYGTVKWRLRHGKSIEEALGIR